MNPGGSTSGRWRARRPSSPRVLGAFARRSRSSAGYTWPVPNGAAGRRNRPVHHAHRAGIGRYLSGAMAAVFHGWVALRDRAVRADPGSVARWRLGCGLVCPGPSEPERKPAVSALRPVSVRCPCRFGILLLLAVLLVSACAPSESGSSPTSTL